ncbi:MAG: hypothetical protein F4039_06575 [Gammaproteobacteria bacterium]|nr:hypothetical protein [Gammaproteobacteria bacterium]MXX94446.1 hypothetical protein [Gammaproteobacteria bacterium]MYF52973.1 hypothetical protein [Gammaproteobacteria bacterium]MYK43733.1 hypothetical protein [Gammaproteobacteria bacterium]
MNLVVSKPNKNTTWYVFGVGGAIIIVCTAIGLFWFLNDQDESKAPVTQQRSNLVVSNSDVLDCDYINSQNGDQSSTLNLERLGTVWSHFERKRLLYECLANAQERELSQYLDKAKTILPVSLRVDIENVVIQQWASINPIEAITHVENYPIVRYREFERIVFTEWMLVDLQEAVRYVGELDLRSRQTIYEVIMNTFSDHSKLDLLQIAQQLDIEPIATELMFKLKAEQPIDDPRQTWIEFLDEYKHELLILSESQTLFLDRVIDSLLVQEPVDAFHFINESLTNIDEKMLILPDVIHRIVSIDPESAFKLALEQQRDESGILWDVVLIWADSDPITALSAVSEIENIELRRGLQQELMLVWAENDPYEALQAAYKFASHEDTHLLTEQLAEFSLASTTPEEALKQLQELDDQVVRTGLTRKIVSKWGLSDLSAALNWIKTEPSIQHMQSQLMTDLLHKLTSTDPQTAMTTALAHPIENDQVGLEAEVIRALSYRDADAALEQIPKLRNERTRLQGLLAIGSQFLRRGDTESIDRAMILGSRLNSEVLQHQYVESLLPGWVIARQEQALFNRIESLPTQEIKAAAAQMLISSSSEQLTKNQIEKLRTYLDESSEKN